MLHILQARKVGGGGGGPTAAGGPMYVQEAGRARTVYRERRERAAQQTATGARPRVAQVLFVASVRPSWGARFCCLVLAEVPGLGTAFFSPTPNGSQMTQMWHAVCVQVILVQHQYSDNRRPWKLTEQ